MHVPRIALTMGDPAGIGPEIALKALSRKDVYTQSEVFLVGDESFLRKYHPRFFKAKKIPFRIVNLKNISRAIKPGQVSALAGRVSGEYIQTAVNMVIGKKVDAIVTAPINKKSFWMGGWGRKYIGHTEMLAALSSSKSVAILLASGPLRAVHVTSHIPLQKVSASINSRRVKESICLAFQGMRCLGISKPKIGVAALNPHGGDGGLMGKEERVSILPAIRKAQLLGIQVDGPIPADVLWPLVKAGRYDVGVAMYHDQGQIAIKLHAFNSSDTQKILTGGVNITLGLPFIRTSPAHGTAFDIAGKNRASDASMVEAVLTAIRMVKQKKHE